jgi:DNA polymerase III subunit beta
MKVTFLAENLQKKLSFVNHAISGKSQLPILSNFLIKAEKGEMSVLATDLEIGIIITVPAVTEEEGETTVPAKTFFDLLSSFTKEKITLELKGTNLELKGERTKASFQTMPKEDFPKIYERKGEIVAEETGENLSKQLRDVVFSASQDNGRPALSGVLLEKEGTGVIAVATDGFRLSLKKNIGVNIKTTEKASLLIPARVVKELLAMPEPEEKVEVYISAEDNQIIFAQGKTTLVGRLIEADFPAYEKILPIDFSTKAEFDKEEMWGAVKRCSVFARETANVIKITIDKEKIKVSANTPSVGENSVDIEAKVQGEENEIAFNARYLLDLFSNIEAETMILEMTGPLNPGVFKIKGDSSFLHLIMPIRVQE